MAGGGAALAAYAAAMRLAAAGLRLRGGADWRERLVLDRPPSAAAIWLHAASVGELTSARRMIADLAAAEPLLVTTNSTTGRDLARGWGLAAQLAPFDAPGPLRRFLGAVRPRLQVTVEGEIWPLRAQALARAGVAQAVIGARLSDRSARAWGRAPGLIRPTLAAIAALSAQDAGSETRLLALGLRPDALWPRLDLKLLGPAEIAAPAPSAARDRTVLAASTHEGEDAPIIDGFLTARAERPDLRLILAPRHPDRADAIAALMTARGLSAARRSAGADETAPVLLADSLGEMARWYAQAGPCIVGGSLVDRGGHTPWEPAAHGCALIHGPHVANFAGSYARLDEAGAARATDAAGLGSVLAALVRDPPAARAMGAAARQVLDARASDPRALVAALLRLAKGQATTDIEAERSARA